MIRVKPKSVDAMIDVICYGETQTASAKKHGVTHQSLSKNLITFQGIIGKLYKYCRDE
jgi:hypothetical protein